MKVKQLSQVLKVVKPFVGECGFTGLTRTNHGNHRKLFQ
jgi:hypothetical protein